MMKQSNEVIGLPVISLADGQEIGTVKSLVINPDKGSVDFLTVEHEDWQVSVRAIPFRKVIGIGEYAVTVESENAIIDLNEIPIANQLVNKKIKIIGTKVMTRKGQLLGDVKEYYVNDDNGHIVAADIKVSEKDVVLASDLVLTFGKDILIVKEDAAEHFKDSLEAVINSVEREQEEVSAVEPPEVAATVEHKEDHDIKAIKDKQIEILLGKKPTKDIVDQNGNVIVEKGVTLTEADITRVQNEGPSYVIELSMNAVGE